MMNERLLKGASLTGWRQPSSAGGRTNRPPLCAAVFLIAAALLNFTFELVAVAALEVAIGEIGIGFNLAERCQQPQDQQSRRDGAAIVLSASPFGVRDPASVGEMPGCTALTFCLARPASRA